MRKEGLEPSRLAVQTPEACASTNFATFARGDPEQNRTVDPRLRRPILYPTELRDHVLSFRIDFAGPIIRSTP